MRPFARFDVSTATFRPDVCIFMGGSLASEQTWSGRTWSRISRAWSGYTGSRVVHIVEVGYAREGFGRAKQLEKFEQHALLQLLLEQNQWTVHYHTVTLGVAGTIYLDALATLTALGVPPTSHSAVTASWAQSSLRLAHALLVCRRHLDSHLISQAFQRPP